MDNLSAPEGDIVWERLFSVLNAEKGPDDGIVEAEVVEPSQGNLDPSQAIVDAFPDAVEAEPLPKATNPAPRGNDVTIKQMDFIRKLCDQQGFDPYEKCSSILGESITSLRDLTKAQAKKAIDSLISTQK